MHKFDQSRLKRLLKMEYTVAELATELDCTARQIRAALTDGAPHRKTETGQYFIEGQAFAAWATPRPAKPMLAEGEAYCLKCRSAVALTILEVTTTNAATELTKGVCPQCGGKINRARRRVEK